MQRGSVKSVATTKSLDKQTEPMAAGSFGERPHDGGAALFSHSNSADLYITASHVDQNTGSSIAHLL